MHQDRDALISKAQAVLDINWTGAFTKPTPHLYPHQWNWDSGFIALGYAQVDMDRAEAELRSLFQGQWKNGMLPHIIFREEKEARYFPGASFWQTHLALDAPDLIQSSGITQPPVQGFCLWHIYQAAADKERALDFVREMYPHIKRLHSYLYRYRDPRQEGLVYIRHPWESGTDNSPSWDEAMQRTDLSQISLPAYEREDNKIGKEAHRPSQRDYDYYVYLLDIYRQHRYDETAMQEHCPFQIQDPLFNAILARSNECMAELASLIGEGTSIWENWYDQTRKAMNQKLWNGAKGAYEAYDLKVEARIPTETSSGLIPLFAGIPDSIQAHQMVDRLLSPAFSGTSEAPARLCPTFNLTDPRFDLQKYWRGPVWMNLNWMLEKGLRRYGKEELASKIRDESLHLIQRFGFFEYFNPIGAETRPSHIALGTDTFSWTAALCLEWLKASRERD